MWQKQPNESAHSGLLLEASDGKWWIAFAFLCPSPKPFFLLIVSQGIITILTQLPCLLFVNKTKSHPAASRRHTWLLSQCTWLPGKPSYRPEGFSKLIYHKKRNPDRRKRRQSAYGLGEPHISFSFTRSFWWRLNTLRFWEHVNITRSETAFSSYHKHTHRASCPNLTADRTFKFWMTLLKGITWESGN